MKIDIETLTSKTITIDVELSDSIKVVKEKIEKIECISMDKSRLIFAGNELEDERTLAEYNIYEGSCIHLVNMLREGVNMLRGGGGPSFVGVTKESYTEVKLGKNGESWRSICRGLNIEGVCMNKKFPAFKKFVFIIPESSL